jgi:hypothetical protein
VLILKEVKVVCSDTLLQVLILKEMEERSGIRERRRDDRLTTEFTESTEGAKKSGDAGAYATPGVLRKEFGFA